MIKIGSKVNILLDVYDSEGEIDDFLKSGLTNGVVCDIKNTESEEHPIHVKFKRPVVGDERKWPFSLCELQEITGDWDI